MKFTPLNASLLALALFAGPVTAQAASTADPGTMVVAQAEDSKIEDIRKFLEGGRNLQKLDDDKLQKRLQRAEKFQRVDGLPDDVAAGLTQEIADINAEMTRRTAAGGTGGDTKAADTKASDTTAADATTADSGGADTGAAGTGASGAGSGNVDSFLASVKPVADLDDKALRDQMRQAADLAKSDGIAKSQKKQLREIVKEARAEMDRRKGGSGDTKADKKSGDTTAGAGTDTGGAADSGDAGSFIASAKSAADLDDKALKDQTRRAAQLSKDSGISDDTKRQLRKIVREGRDELEKRKGGTSASGTSGDGTADSGDGTGKKRKDRKADSGETSGAGTADAGASDADSEARAKVFISDKTDAKSLDRKVLRKRLSDMRDLLGSDKLSPETKKALRQRLQDEKGILRGDVSRDEGKRKGKVTDATAGGALSAAGGDLTIVDKTKVKVVIDDRRPSRDLKDDELQRRIDVLRVVILDTSYSDADRGRFKLVLDQDRAVLKGRLLDARKVREAKLRGKPDIDINLSLNFDPGRPPPPRSVFAAEADDAEIADVLSAPPRRKIERRYTVDEVENDPGLRDAVARIEIDTVHFGFGESFLREEEVDNLDRIAEVMEKILAKSPGEVFMIEGHTDAVGSDEANLQLSRERAKAVKEALATYYVIPPENLKTVGFGEKYLKIPTSDAEAENRRVSIARITPLVGAID